MRLFSLVATATLAPLLSLTALAVTGTPAPACRMEAASATAAGDGCAERWMDTHLRLNDLFTVGTHNSYKQAIPPADYRVIAARPMPGRNFQVSLQIHFHSN